MRVVGAIAASTVGSSAAYRLTAAERLRHALCSTGGMTLDLANKMESLTVSEGRVVRDTERPRPDIRSTPSVGEGRRPPWNALREVLARPRVDTGMRWVVANGLGHLLGLGAVGVVGWQAVHGAGADLTAWMPVNGRDVACAVEGAILGGLQWRVMRRALPDMVRSEWVFATGLGAFVASELGLIPWTLRGESAGLLAVIPSAFAPTARYVSAVGAGVVAGLVLSLFQGWVLRRSGARAGWWLAANALGWSAATPLLVWASRQLDRVHGVASVALALAASLLAGAVVGASVGAVAPRTPRVVRPS